MKEPVPHAPKKDDNSGEGKDDITDQTDSGLEDAISQALEQAMPASDEAWPEGLDVGLAGALEVELSGSQDTEPVEAAEGSEQSSPSESIAGGDQPSQGEDNAYPEVDLDAAALEAALASSLEAGLGLDAAQEGAPAPAGGSARESGFFNRRKAAAQKLQQDQSIRSGDMGKHNAWFQAAYEGAGGDEAAVPWADLRPKPELLRWLTENPGEGRMAIDVGCGLGDNADALAQAGWKVTAFDISKDAISWAKKRFPDSAVNFEAANLMKPPPLWGGAFDLVFECYNLQAFAPGDLRGKAIEAVSRLVRPGGVLFVYSLLGKDSDDLDGGPPWPLTLSDLDAFKRHGLEIDIQRPGVHIESSGMAPFVTALFNKPAR